MIITTICTIHELDNCSCVNISTFSCLVDLAISAIQIKQARLPHPPQFILRNNLSISRMGIFRLRQ